MNSDKSDGPPVQPTDKAPHPWFGPKRIGWGFRPASWQGWLLVLGVVVVFVVLRRFVF